jgi:hypothetical protein
MKRILFLLPVFIAISSCHLTYNGEERILFQGKITDENGNPMPNVYVSAHANKDFTLISPSDDDEVSYDFTDESGNFKMLFPSPQNEEQMQVFMNFEGDNPQYSKTNFYNIQDGNYEDFKIDFGTISLYPTDDSVLLTISVEDDFENQITGWNLEGKVAENNFNFSPMNSESEIYFDYSSQNQVAKNQTIILHYYYTHQNSTEILENTAEIEIHDQPVNYEITF